MPTDVGLVQRVVADLPVFVDEVVDELFAAREKRFRYEEKLHEFKSKNGAIEEREKDLEEFEIIAIEEFEKATEFEKDLEEFVKEAEGKRERVLEEFEKDWEEFVKEAAE